jgi:predicted amidohydrolase
MEPAPYLAACVQLRSTDDLVANLARADHWIARAAGYGAKLVATPENTTFLGPSETKLAAAEPIDGPTGRHFADLARSLGIHLLVGSVAERLDEHRCWNTSLLYGPDGLLARYRKLHLFDVDVPGGPRFVESAHVAAGDDVVVVATPLGRIGLTVCYDVRFPELYAACVAAGAEVLTVPSAFTFVTGQAHWHALLRARAIETQCYVLAPAQEGRHDATGARHSYGHSLLVDPWGVVLADAADGEGLALAEVDLGRVRAVRAAMPVATHRRGIDVMPLRSSGQVR